MMTDLYRFPIKGLSPERLDGAELLAGEGLPGDRVLAIARKPENFDPDKPKAEPKHKFLMLMRDEALAQLSTQYIEATSQLLISKGGETLLDISLADDAGRGETEAFFKRFLEDAALDPKVVSSPGHKFTDISVVSPEKMRAISLINLNSIKALEDADGRAFHPMRFRANVYFGDVPAWAEFDWVGKEIQIGGAKAQVVMRTQRCAATQVNPDTAERDINTPAAIKTHFGHFDMGVYAEIIESGPVAVGDKVTLL